MSSRLGSSSRRSSGGRGRSRFTHNGMSETSPWQLSAKRRAFFDKNAALFCPFPLAPLRTLVEEGAAVDGHIDAPSSRRRPAGDDGDNNEDVADADAGAAAAPPRRSRRRRRGGSSNRGRGGGGGSAAAESAVDNRLPINMPLHIEATPEDPDDIICSICCAALVNATLAPCGHNKYCCHCCTTLLDRPNAVCPDCRMPIASVLARYDVIRSRDPAAAARINNNNNNNNVDDGAAQPSAEAVVPQLPPLEPAEAGAEVDIMAEIRRHRREVAGNADEANPRTGVHINSF